MVQSLRLSGRIQLQVAIVAPNRKKHNVPVSRNVVRLVVRRTSLRALGAVCLPRVLRMTSAVMTVQRGGAGCLMLMSWSGQRAFVYSWAQRKIIYPKLIGALKLENQSAATSNALITSYADMSLMAQQSSN